MVNGSMEEKFRESKQRQARYLKRSKGDLWASTYSEGVFLVKFPRSERGKDYLNPVVKNFSENEGLPFGYTRDIRYRGKGSFLGKKK